MKQLDYINDITNQYLLTSAPHWNRISEEGPTLTGGTIGLELAKTYPSVQLHKGEEAFWHLSEAGLVNSENGYGIHDYYTKGIEQSLEHLHLLKIEPESVGGEPIELVADLTKLFNGNFQLIVIAEKASVSQVRLLISDDGEDASNIRQEGVTNGLIKLHVAQDAKLKFTRIQKVGRQEVFLEGVLGQVAKNGQLVYQGFDIGGRLVVTDFSTYLEGENSQYDAESVYLGNGEQKLDISYRTYHRGVRSESHVNVVGALLDNAKKVFRGNLTFEHGSRKSKGSEKETVVLLDKTVKSDTIPALFCQEDDVIGEHAASAGQIDDNQLFYLMSRGFTEQKAKELVIMGMFKPIIDLVKEPQIEEKLTSLIYDKMGYVYENNQ